MGIAKRVTFVVDRAGKIAKVFPEVKPAGHGAEILAVLTSLKS
jgi:peroxiredoxin